MSVEQSAELPVVRLVLFIAGESPNSAAALANLRRAIELEGAERFELEVVDVFEHAERALSERVFVTPTLVRHAPTPIRRLLGDLSSTIELHSLLRGRYAGGPSGDVRWSSNAS